MHLKLCYPRRSRFAPIDTNRKLKGSKPQNPRFIAKITLIKKKWVSAAHPKNSQRLNLILMMLKK